jgi:hypothetical protein
MNDEQIKNIIDDHYDSTKEDTLMSMVRDFYSRKMLSVVIMVWFWGVLFMAGAVYCGIHYFKTDHIRSQIAYAAVFICCVTSVGFMKVFAWEMIHRIGIKRAVKRLELRIAELIETVKDK